jgi:hypothetical protein
METLSVHVFFLDSTVSPPNHLVLIPCIQCLLLNSIFFLIAVGYSIYSGRQARNQRSVVRSCWRRLPLSTFALVDSPVSTRRTIRSVALCSTLYRVLHQPTSLELYGVWYFNLPSSFQINITTKNTTLTHYPPQKQSSRDSSHWIKPAGLTGANKLTANTRPVRADLCTPSHNHDRLSPITLQLPSHSSRLGEIHPASQDVRSCTLHQPLPYD